MNPNDPQKHLRSLADVILANTLKPESGFDSTSKLLHELQVHQIELELQNGELLRSQQALEEARNRYSDLYEFAPVAYLTLDEQGLIYKINLTGATLLGVERQKLSQRHFADFIDPKDSDCWHLFFHKLLNQEQPQSISLKLNTAHKPVIYVQLDGLRIFSAANHCSLLRITLTDITALKLAEIELRVAAVAFESEQAMMVTDANGTILRVNQAFTTITGYSAEEAVGKNPRILQSGRHNADFYLALWHKICTTGSWAGEVWNRRKNAQIYPQYLTITAVKDTNNIVSHYVATFHDISIRKAAAEKIERLAFYDPLTDLPNRRLLFDRLKLALAASHRRGGKGALLFIDLDNFKNLNDTLGHDVGDILLQQVAKRLISCVREVDTVARLSGDEFVIMLEDLSSHSPTATAQAKEVANKILTALNQSYQLGVHDYQNTPSIGITLFNGHEKTEYELLKQADTAMYQAKNAGRNTLRFFDSGS